MKEFVLCYAKSLDNLDDHPYRSSYILHVGE